MSDVGRRINVMSQAPSILVLFNEPVLKPDHPESASEVDILDSVADTVKVLAAAGFDVRQLGISLDPQPLLDEIRRNRPDVVFNLFEGVPIRQGTEVGVASLLEWLDLPFTGCPSACLSLGRNKAASKHLLAAGGLPTARYVVVEREPAPAWPHGWPAIVKPATQDASVGIEQGSVVTSPEQLTVRMRHVLQTFGPPVLVEEFVGGREFHVNIIEDGDAPDRSLIVLPFAEIAYREARPDWWPVYTYTAKWDEQSMEYADCPLVAPVSLPPDQTAALHELGARAFRLFGCRDLARIDVRMTPSGEFRILEMNPNPYLISLALVRGLEAIGRPHEHLVVQMALAALARGGMIVPPGTITIPSLSPSVNKTA
jgi:D-alanine-D-alanine ligase